MNTTNTSSSVSSGPFEKCAAGLSHPLYSGATSANVIVTSLSALVQVFLLFRMLQFPLPCPKITRTEIFVQVALLITLQCRRRELREHIRDRYDLASHLLPLHVGMLRALVAVYLFQVNMR